MALDQQERPGLSDGQKACLRLVGDGLTSKEIALETGLSHQTVDQYLSKAATLLGASNRRDAARKFAEFEVGEFNKAEFKPASLANHGRITAPPASAEHTAPPSGTQPQSLLYRLVQAMRIPPVGGRHHDLNPAQLIEAAARVALITLMTIIAAVVVFMGIMKLSS